MILRLERDKPSELTRKLVRSSWGAVLDTGSTGDLQLPNSLFEQLNPTPWGIVDSVLANSEVIQEEVFIVDCPFDGETIAAEATFTPNEEILWNRLASFPSLGDRFSRWFGNTSACRLVTVFHAST